MEKLCEVYFIVASSYAFTDAADNLCKEKAFSAARACLTLAQLVSLQLRRTTVQLINLPASAARAQMSQQADFADALTIAMAYSKCC